MIQPDALKQGPMFTYGDILSTPLISSSSSSSFTPCELKVEKTPFRIEELSKRERLAQHLSAKASSSQVSRQQERNIRGAGMEHTRQRGSTLRHRDVFLSPVAQRLLHQHKRVAKDTALRASYTPYAKHPKKSR